MKIGPFEAKNLPAPAAAERKAAAQPAAAEPSAQVQLSSAAQGLKAADGDPAFDGAKVERIAQAIRDGKFTVNPEAIADKLIVNAQELLGRKSS
ncbi:MAG: flagellar biosynthesis anti-sigma factor FlgM [Rubrivivax sp.]|jgi:negative regulator of flagellin synthesis FlgM|nr:flagellar biosynthesis anti-sigma factor FlgM [Rubrivivax sp.]